MYVVVCKHYKSAKSYVLLYALLYTQALPKSNNVVGKSYMIKNDLS